MEETYLSFFQRLTQKQFRDKSFHEYESHRSFGGFHIFGWYNHSTMNRVITALIVVVLLILGYVGYTQIKSSDSEVVLYGEDDSLVLESEEEVLENNSQNLETMTSVTLKTSKGDIELELYPDLAPKAVDNFTKLASEDFYDEVIFHRVIKDFMIQGGDPTGTGTGGPGYTFEDEFDGSHPEAQKGYVRGTLAMANAGPNTNGSQFFIMHKDYALPYSYTIFGRVTEGMDVVDQIANVETGAGDKPVEDVVIEDVELGE